MEHIYCYRRNQDCITADNEQRNQDISVISAESGSRCVNCVCKGQCIGNRAESFALEERSNQVPLSHAVRLVRRAPQMPPTCLSLRKLPKSSPRLIYRIAAGRHTARQRKIFAVGFRPISIATAKQINA